MRGGLKDCQVYTPCTRPNIESEFDTRSSLAYCRLWAKHQATKGQGGKKTMKTLIVHFSQTGFTRKVAERIRDGIVEVTG